MGEREDDQCLFDPMLADLRDEEEREVRRVEELEHNLDQANGYIRTLEMRLMASRTARRQAEEVRDLAMKHLNARTNECSSLEAELAQLKQPAYVLRAAEELLAEMGVRGDVPAHALLHNYNAADAKHMDADVYEAEERRRG